MRIFSEFEHELNHGGAQQAAGERERVRANLAGVKSLLAVASAKGGTGKSALAVNIAVLLALAGKKIALVDADLNSPSIMAMLGMKPQGRCYSAEMVEPAAGPFGLRVLAGDMLCEGEEPVISFCGDEPETPSARAPAVAELSYSAALTRLLGNTRFDQLDLAIIDLPPGLEPLYRLLRVVTPSGVILVSHPAASPVRHLGRALEMGAPVIGIVENMVGFDCAGCRTVRPLFPQGETARVVRESSVPLLARLPFDPRFAESCDRAAVFVHENPQAPMTKQLAEVVRKIESILAERARAPHPDTPAPEPEIQPGASSSSE
jgi:ATP-binding protein involved in chromosome partitioning